MGKLNPQAESAQRCGKLAKLGCRVRRCRLSASTKNFWIYFHWEPLVVKYISRSITVWQLRPERSTGKIVDHRYNEEECLPKHPSADQENQGGDSWHTFGYLWGPCEKTKTCEKNASALAYDPDRVLARLFPPANARSHTRRTFPWGWKLMEANVPRVLGNL